MNPSSDIVERRKDAGLNSIPYFLPSNGSIYAPHLKLVLGFLTFPFDWRGGYQSGCLPAYKPAS